MRDAFFAARMFCRVFSHGGRMAEGNWIKLHRDARDHEVFQDEWLWRLWTWCLMSANFRPTKWRGETLEPGEFITGRHSGSESLCVSPSKFSRGIQRLIDLDCISTRANSQFTVVSICNWATYQCGDQHCRTAGDTAADTASGQPVIQPADTEEECKESKEGKKKTNTPASPSSVGPEDSKPKPAKPEPTSFDIWWAIYPRKAAKGDARKAWPKAVAEIQRRDGSTKDAAESWLIAFTSEFSKSPKATGGYCPYPATWLNSERFSDDPSVWSSESPDGTPQSSSKPGKLPRFHDGEPSDGTGAETFLRICCKARGHPRDEISTVGEFKQLVRDYEAGRGPVLTDTEVAEYRRWRTRDECWPKERVTY